VLVLCGLRRVAAYWYLIVFKTEIDDDDMEAEMSPSNPRTDATDTLKMIT
jgi:hypothetical protein